MSRLLSLSVVMIAKNSARYLSESLVSIIWADEIILLDAGSHDNTINIARAAGAKVFTNANWLGYGIQRQRAQHFATGDYILMIDTDEQVSSQLRNSIQSVLTVERKPGVVYSIERRNYFLGHCMYNTWYSDRVIRLYERDRYQYNNNKVHESLSYKSAKIIPLHGDLFHFTCQNIVSFKNKQLKYANIWAKEHHQKGKKTSLINIVNHTIYRFLKTLFLQGSMLNGKKGWILAMINAQYTFIKYKKLWMLNFNFSKKTK